MNSKRKFGLIKLAKQTLAVITASLTSLTMNESKASAVDLNFKDGSNDSLNYQNFQKNIFKPKLVLKLNQNNLDNGTLVMHVSHSSHRSHSSHSSHSSHFSSSSGESSPSVPAYTPSVPPKLKEIPSNTPAYPSNSGSHTEVLTNYTLGSREMHKGCEGTDVEEIQKMLLNLNYDVLVTGFYGEKTEEAVKRFKGKYELQPTGKIDSKTLNVIKNQKK